ncbi:dihydrofolate reductase family protein [Agrococcus sp. SGAir0287]|uniref:dihydrofolate reductase family protein n=1 Tax=Agrococcus sp. SGAir0287 TaxID=2070347 RepID=UPI001586C439|nr:dihydrofolate reductase family protein [Agrococcus sp. SGAir0287]
MTGIDRILPTTATDLDDDALADDLADVPDRWVRLTMIASLDGATAHDGASGGLGDDADVRVLAAARRVADAVLVGAGTARAEGYEELALDAESVAWRRERDLPEHPVLVLVSGSLDLDPTHPMLQRAPRRPLVLTTDAAAREVDPALAAVADVVGAGEEHVEPHRAMVVLHDRDLLRIQCEGGPSLAAAMLAANVVDETCLTIASRIEGGASSRIGAIDETIAHRMRLHALLRAGDTLVVRSVRDR